MNSSEWRADDRRADDFQSIVRKWSPGRYGRELATSARPPRRRLVAPPGAVPSRRRRGYSGIRSAGAATTSGRVAAENLQLALVRRLGTRGARQDELAELLQRALAAEQAGLRGGRRRGDDTGGRPPGGGGRPPRRR